MHCKKNVFALYLYYNQFEWRYIMATAVLQTRIDAETKQEAESLFNSLGLDITTSIRLFLRQSINQLEDCEKE